MYYRLPLGPIGCVGLLGLALSCGHTPLHRTTGPSISKEGIRIELKSDRCYLTRSTEKFPPDAEPNELNLALDVRVANGTAHTATLEPERIQVAGVVRGKQIELQPSTTTPVTLEPGETKVVPLTYSYSGRLDCRNELLLDPSDAVVIGGNPVSLAPIRFQASG